MYNRTKEIDQPSLFQCQIWGARGRARSFFLAPSPTSVCSLVNTYLSTLGLGYLGTKNKIKDYDSVKNVIDFNFITITVNRLYVRRSCLSNKVALLTLCDEGPSSISSFAV
jgi:hypothetical protein